MVIQRWQSVLLLMAGIAMGVFSFASLAQIQTTLASFDFTALGFSYEGIPTDGAPSGYMAHTYILFTISIMAAVLPIITIFLYKNMPLQKRLCFIDIFFIITAGVVATANAYTLEEGADVQWKSACIAPIVGLFAVFYAYRRIVKDQKTLRDADRIR